MKKTVFANWGHARQGKSDTIKRIAKIILVNYPNATTDPTEIDFSADITVTITIDELKIGIESQGDPNSRLPDSLKKFSGDNCDIIVCATRTSGETEKTVQRLAPKYEIIWVTNYRYDQYDKAEKLNQFSAGQIFSLIQQRIKNKI